ncbi:MAG TPA: GAF domain-containing protein, partial [Anaerolineae bacterium]
MARLFSRLENARLYQGMLRANRELEQRVAERTAELAQANAQLTQEVSGRTRVEDALRRQNEYLAALHDTALGLVSRLDLTDLLHDIVVRAGQLLGTPHGFIYLLAPDGSELERRVGVGVFDADRVPRLKPGEGLTGQVWQSDQPIVVNDYDNWSGRSSAGVGLVHALAGIPLHSGGQVVGVLALGSDRESKRIFGDEEVQLLQRFAQLASIALDNARLFVENARLLEAAREQARRQAALFRIADAASAAMDMQAFYRAIHRSVGELMVARNFYIALYDETRHAINFAFYEDEMETDLPDPQAWQTLGESRLGKGLTAYVIRTGQPYHDAPEKFADLVARGEVEMVGALSIDWLGVPLKSGDRILGAMVVQSYTENIRYTDDDLDLLVFVSQHVATALQRARLMEETRQRVAELELVNRIGQVVASQLELEAVIKQVGEQIREAFNAQLVYVALYSHQTNQIHFPYDYDSGQWFPDEPIPLGEGLVSRVIQSRLPLMINRDLAQRLSEWGIRNIGSLAKSYLGVPILVGDEVIGAISVQSTQQEGRFTESDLRLLATIAASVGVTIENARLFEETQKARRAAEDANAAKSAFLANVSHELRTPLTSVMGFAKIIKKRLQDVILPMVTTDEARVRRAAQQVSANIGIIISEGERLTALINDVLDLAKIEAGKVEWLAQPVHIAEVIDQAAAATEALFA